MGIRQIYITSDGRQFTNYSDAYIHDREIELDKIVSRVSDQFARSLDELLKEHAVNRGEDQ